jgi:hypothetical protein
MSCHHDYETLSPPPPTIGVLHRKKQESRALIPGKETWLLIVRVSWGRVRTSAVWSCLMLQRRSHLTNQRGASMSHTEVTFQMIATLKLRIIT